MFKEHAKDLPRLVLQTRVTASVPEVPGDEVELEDTEPNQARRTNRLLPEQDKCILNEIGSVYPLS
jgi:hypothetical protein